MNSTDPILLVEDDLLAVMTFKRALKDINAKNKLYVQHDGEAALDFLQNHQHPLPTLIFLDLNMPRMNGIEFLKILKADPQWRKIPVVILTTSEETQDQLAGFDLTTAGYIVKPLEYHDFVKKLLIAHQYWCITEIPDLTPSIEPPAALDKLNHD